MATQRPLVGFALDLRAQEVTRLTAVLAAMEDWDPGRVLADETPARRMLYSNLDAVQHAVYALLIGEGVLDDAV